MTVHEQVLNHMKTLAEKFAKSGVVTQMPHPSGEALGTHYTEIDYGKMLAAQFAFNPRFTNPIHTFQGGMLSAIIDEVFGPLSYMAAEKPAVAIEMSTSYLRPFLAKDEWVQVKAEIVSQTKSLIVLRAEVRSKAGKLIATATNHSLIASESFLARPRTL